MSKGKKYKIPHKYLRKYQRGTWCQEVSGIGISISMNRKFIIKIICLVLCLFIALNAVTQLLTMSNTAASITGIVVHNSYMDRCRSNN